MENYKTLALAVAQQAVEDVKMLQGVGIIRKDGSVIDDSEWPKRTSKTTCKKENIPYKGFRKVHEVKELLLWLRENKGHVSLGMILEECGMGIKPQDICNQLGV
jgi:hypothetical protein